MANKIKLDLYGEAQKVIKDKEKQKKLHRKYKDVPENERIRYTVPTWKKLFRSFTDILFGVALVVAIISLTVPGPKEEMIELFSAWWEEIAGILPF